MAEGWRKRDLENAQKYSHYCHESAYDALSERWRKWRIAMTVMAEVRLRKATNHTMFAARNASSTSYLWKRGAEDLLRHPDSCISGKNMFLMFLNGDKVPPRCGRRFFGKHHPLPNPLPNMFAGMKSDLVRVFCPRMRGIFLACLSLLSGFLSKHTGRAAEARQEANRDAERFRRYPSAPL